MTSGIHHITAIASDPQRNLDFYTQILGLRLVKKTVNQDDVLTYHLFYGDRLGHPGMDLTFFTFQPPHPGRNGNGLVTTISLAVPEASLPFWQQRFSQLAVNHQQIAPKFGFPRLKFSDPDQQQLELVGLPASQLDHAADIWTIPEISTDNAIRHFHSATLNVSDLSLVDPILTAVFGYQRLESQDSLHIYQAPQSRRASYLVVHQDKKSGPGITGSGTVHHIAFRTPDAQTQLQLRNKVLELGLRPTEVINRFYFKSVYFRTPAGILFEIATDGPGFTTDEPEASLGISLSLPPFLEAYRADIEAQLPSITIPPHE